jgi:hypothetical protein
MTPGSKYDGGFGPPIDDKQTDDHHPNNPGTTGPPVYHLHPYPELESHSDDSSYNSSRIISNGNAVILKEFEATNLSRQYSKNQGKGSKMTTAPILTLDGVDWSGFSGAAHKTEGGPRSSKRLHASEHEEMLEVVPTTGSQVQESTLRLVQRKLSLEVNRPKNPTSSSSSTRRVSPGKYQSRRVSARNLLTPPPASPDITGEIAGGTMPLKDPQVRTTSKERRARNSSRERQPRGTSRSRRDGGESSHTRGSSQRSRRILRNRPSTGDVGIEGNTKADKPKCDVGGSGRRKLRSSSRRNNLAESGDAHVGACGDPVARSERKLTNSKPKKERSLSSGAVRDAVAPKAERRPRKHRSAGVIDVSRTSDRATGRSVSPINKYRGKSPSSSRGLAAASATTLEVGSRPKSTRIRRGSHGNIMSSRDRAGSELIANNGSLRW